MKQEARRVGIAKKPWGNSSALDALDLESLTEQSVVLGAPISKVQKALEKPMKPGRETLSVVRYKNGSIEEVTDKVIGLIDEGQPEADEPEVSTVTEVEPKKPKVAAAAVTVAQPTLGCPAPDFEAAELRANRVLEAFLNPQQLYDFRTENAFIVRGADTGHLYQVTSRNNPTKLSVSMRSLYDLTERRPYCVHDWTVPAAEEMLTLALFVATPGNESYVRHIPDNVIG